MSNLDELAKEMMERESIRQTLKHRYEDDKKSLPAMQKYFGRSYADFLEELVISVLHKQGDKK